MIRSNRWIGCWLSIGVVGATIAPCHRVLPQILPDGTLPQNSIVTPEGNLQRITGGTQAGENLFHSFGEFNVRTGETAHFDTHFDNAGAIENIITRVTGGQLSNIDGLIRTNGSANLFLVNPNGILFGANAQLDVGGSFIASTASGVRFADGSEFVADPSDRPLLTVSVPVGLQFHGSEVGSKVGGITTNGANLAVSARQTLALVGGDVTVSDGTLVAGGRPFIDVDGIPTATTLGGRIELGSVREGEVGIAIDDRGLSFDYGNVADFGNIQIEGDANIDTTGTGGGDIQIMARNLQVSDRARVFSITQGSQPGGDVTVNATESIEISGVGDFPETIRQFTSTDVNQFNIRVAGLYNLTFGTGNGGALIVKTPQLLVRHNAAILGGAQGVSAGDAGALSIEVSERIEVTTALIGTSNGANVSGDGGDLAISTPQLRLQDNGLVLTTTLGPSRGGDLTVEADNIELSRAQPFPFNPILTFGTAIATGTLASGDAGDLTIDARTLSLQGGAQINSGTIGSGSGGNLRIDASESVTLTGGQTVQATAVTDNFINTSITTGTVTTGAAGDLILTTPQLTLDDGAFIAAETFGTGRGGSVKIDAETIELSGVSRDGILPTSISARSISFLGGGDAGNVEIDARQIEVRDGATLTASSRSSGSAGNLEILAEEIVLDRGGEITATTARGEQGNITLNTDGLFLRNGSRITTNSTESATGGNITIDTDTLVALENSDITANAEESFGGRVAIVADGIFGTELREQLTPNSDITATSQLGGEFSGTVTITTPEVDPSSGLVELSSVLLNAEDAIAQSCLVPSSRRQGRFTIVGTGGLPIDPDTPISSPFETFAIPSVSSQEREEMISSGALVEAEGIFRLEDDRFVLGRPCSSSLEG
ncbi:MAG: S-layer family protein [Cyanobacteriota bacterium]|nr:S-layer family protein [Cyanobacteriota bacterium]